MKKLLIPLFCLLLSACTNTQSVQDKNEENKNSGKIEACDVESSDCEDNSKNTADKSFEEISMDEAISYFTDGKSGILLFGFEKCPWCKEAEPVLKEVSIEQDVPVHYILTRDENKELLYTDDQKAEILKYVGKYEQEDDDGNLALYVPLVVAIQDGEVIDAHLSTVDSHDAHERVMTEEEKSELKQIYTKLFQSYKSQ